MSKLRAKKKKMKNYILVYLCKSPTFRHKENKQRKARVTTEYENKKYIFLFKANPIVHNRQTHDTFTLKAFNREKYKFREVKNKI